ncbi:MAG: peptidoglycan-binding protein, partial [Tabrizicola sp.]|nr:peptidoglycan-binding protein [Tabrizicola sp.]
GEIGMVQMLPKDILERGIDGDGDGLILLKTSQADAILSGARMLQHHGWRAGEPWLVEVTLPESFDWSQTGLDTEKPIQDWEALGVTSRNGPLTSGLSASILLPQGRKGPAFLAYPNYRVLFEWNKSFVYVTTAAYFATRIEGAKPYVAGNPDPALELEQMKALQEKLAALGHDVGQIDGILGAGTRTAVQKEQSRLGLPADGWPNRPLLDAL